MSSQDLERVREAFDHLALVSDDLAAQNPIGVWTLQVNFANLLTAFSSPSCLLDIGCGTGRDAVELAKLGHRVLAFDVSERMVSKARERVLSQGVQHRVVVTRGRCAELADVLEASPWRVFDGVYANFSLTFEESLRQVAAALHSVTKPGAFLLCTLPNRLVLSEIVLYGLRLRFRGFLWRFEDPLFLDVHGHNLRIRTYSPWQVRKCFEGFFDLRGLVGLPTFLPPVYLHGLYRKLGGGRVLSERLDTLLAGKYPWNRLGDNTLFRFRRSER